MGWCSSDNTYRLQPPILAVGVPAACRGGKHVLRARIDWTFQTQGTAVVRATGVRKDSSFIAVPLWLAGAFRRSPMRASEPKRPGSSESVAHNTPTRLARIAGLAANIAVDPVSRTTLIGTEVPIGIAWMTLLA